MGRWLLRICAHATAVGVAWSCTSSGVFDCADASECGADAICDAGHCAFPDAACPSGYSYGTYSPPGLAGECVPPAGGTADTTTTSTSTSTSSDLTVSSDPAGTSGDPANTTGPVDPNGTTATTTSGTTGEDPWLAGDWPRRLPIVIDASRVAGSLSDFIVLVSWSGNDALASGATGTDALRFAAFDQPLSYEIEAFDPDSGAIVAWVQLPVLDADEDTTFHLYYGGADGSARDGDPWADFGGVWHLSGDPGMGVPDATVHQNDGVSIGSALQIESGKIGDAVRFDGATDGITIEHDASLEFGAGLTLSAWVLGDSFPVDAGVIVAKATTFGSGADNTYWMRTYEAWLEMAVRVPEPMAAGWNGFGLPQLGSWHHVAGVHDGDTLRLFFDGVEVSSTPSAPASDDEGHPFRIGSWGEGEASSLATRTWDGLIDEVRMTTAARTAEWIATEFSNQDDPEAFAVVGSPQSAP